MIFVCIIFFLNASGDCLLWTFYFFIESVKQKTLLGVISFILHNVGILIDSNKFILLIREPTLEKIFRLTQNVFVCFLSFF